MRQKRQRRWLTLIALVLTLGLTAGGAFAASAPAQDLYAYIPFEFVIQEVEMPAGTYLVSQPDPLDPTVMEIEDLDSEKNAVFTTRAIPNTWSKVHSQPAALVFDQVGQLRFLDEVWIPAHSNARAVPDSERENRVSERGDEVEQVTILLTGDLAEVEKRDM